MIHPGCDDPDCLHWFYLEREGEERMNVARVRRWLRVRILFLWLIAYAVAYGAALSHDRWLAVGCVCLLFVLTVAIVVVKQHTRRSSPGQENTE